MLYLQVPAGRLGFCGVKSTHCFIAPVCAHTPGNHIDTANAGSLYFSAVRSMHGF